MKNKLLTLFLALAASVGTLFAQSGTCGANLTWTLSSGTLTISGTGAMTNYTSYSDVPWDSYSSSIKTVIIEDGVTSIGNNAFCFCSSLTSVTIPNSVTSIGEEAFNNCSKLTSVTIPNSVTSIGDDAFYWCTGLTSITIPNSVTSIGYDAFSGCSSLTSITIPNSVTSIGEGAFSGCSSLTSITIPNSVTSIGYDAFSYCTSLTSITIPNSVTTIGQYAFRNCSKLTSIVVENGNTKYDSRNNCNAIIETATNTLIAGCQTTIIPNSVTSIGEEAFNNCSSLTSITIPNSVTSIGYRAFSYCTSLTSITIPNSVTSIRSRAFYGCSKLTSIVVENGNTKYDSRNNCNAIIETATNTLIAGCQTTIIPNSVTYIGYAAFECCSSLTSITIPNSVTSIGDWAFSGCSSLTSITIPNSVTSIGNYAFRGCSSLTSITIPNSVTSIGYDAFSYCTSLTSITIPNSVTSIGGYAFRDCSSLTSITCEAVNPPVLDKNVFTNVDTSIPLYVPAQSIELYKAADQWKDFTNILPIPDVEPQKFTITWQDEDGNIIKTDEVAQGTTPAFTGTTPTKPATNEYTYEFAGWLPKIKPATEDTKYTTYFIPTQQQESKVYTVNINGENCSLNINNQYPEGTVITLEAVADECFEFRQWSDGNKDNPRTITITANTNLTAEFNKVRYTVTGQPSTGGKVQIRKQ